MVDFYIVRLRCGSERKACEQLQFWGCSTYLPRIAILRKTRFWTAPHLIFVPAFPGYTFVEASDSVFEAIDNSSYCFGILHTGDKPDVISQNEIERVQQMEQLWMKSPVILKGRLTPGQSVKILGGPLEGFRAIVLASEPKTSRISINTPGRCGAHISIPTALLIDELAEAEKSLYNKPEPLTYRKGLLAPLAHNGGNDRA